MLLQSLLCVLCVKRIVNCRVDHIKHREIGVRRMRLLVQERPSVHQLGEIRKPARGNLAGKLGLVLLLVLGGKKNKPRSENKTDGVFSRGNLFGAKEALEIEDAQILGSPGGGVELMHEHVVAAVHQLELGGQIGPNHWPLSQNNVFNEREKKAISQ
jgi:hypothetical protein